MQVHSHITLLAMAQTFGAQVQVDFWRTLNLNLGAKKCVKIYSGTFMVHMILSEHLNKGTKPYFSW